jgi:HK97 family phage prohead protease
MPQIRQIPKLHTRAAFVPTTLNGEERTVEITWSTGAQVRRFDWWTEKEWIEELSMDPAHVRLDRLNNGAPLLPDHRTHGIDNVIGVVERAWIVGKEGRATIRFSKREEAQKIFDEVKDGILRNISVGYKVHKLEEQKERQGDLKVLRAVDWEPIEISLVSIPADSSAQVRSEGEQFSVTILNTRGNAMTGQVEEKQAETRGAETPTETVKVDPTEIRKAERQRIAEIRSFGQKAGADEKTIEGMIERGLSAVDAKAEMIEKWSSRVDDETSRSDTSVTTDERDKFVDAAVEAIVARSGHGKIEGANPYRGLSLREMARECLVRGGIDARGLNPMDMVGRAFTQSTSDFPVLLENAMHKTLLNAYRTTSDTWTRFCRIGSVSDFRAHNRYRTGSFGNLDALNELGEFKNKSIPDGEKASITAGTKGNIINISRQAIINDDLGAFVTLAADLARSAKRTIEADVYALLAANAALGDGIALFHADHDNLAGTAAIPSVASIEAGRVAMAKQTDVSGNDYLDLRPAIWVGGMAWGGTARVVNDAQYDPDTANKLQRPNMVRNLFRDVVDTPRITGNEWYLFADPSEVAAIEVAFLDGEQEPFLEVQDGFSVDGARYKVRLDYGVAALDYRAVYKNAGAAS